MSKIVKCEICGSTFNKSYVKAHMRLAHDKKSKAGPLAKNEQKVMKEFLRLYESLSDEEKKELQVRLKAEVSAS